MENIEPEDIPITGRLPIQYTFTYMYYLGYGRNAWHSTWINRYYPDSVSFDEQSLKDQAERLRVQGNVFKIEAVPALVLGFTSNSFALISINERATWYYNELIRDISGDRTTNFWRHLPPSSGNSVIVLRLGATAPQPQRFRPTISHSSSAGGQYLLNWDVRPGNAYKAARKFHRRLAAILLGGG
jgi:hypothetical protein